MNDFPLLEGGKRWVGGGLLEDGEQGGGGCLRVGSKEGVDDRNLRESLAWGCMSKNVYFHFFFWRGVKKFTFIF